MPTKLLSLFASSALLLGCASRPAPPIDATAPDTPLGLQLLRTEEQLRNYPFFTLLSFERDADEVFAPIDGPPARVTDARPHTGLRSLELPAGTRNLAIKLPSLHSGRDWPGDWTLIGAYFYSQQPQRLSATYDVNGVALATCTVELPANRWTPVLLDIAAALDGKPHPPIGTLRFNFGAGSRAALWCDDVIEMNNTQVVVDGGGWTVKERGFQIVADRPASFRVSLKTPEATDQGWTLAEANEIRAVFNSPGRQKRMVLYSDGRQITDGRFAALGQPKGLFERQHASPAEITVTTEGAKLERNLPGDENNDGYLETQGVYAITAAGPRLDLRIDPDGTMLNGILDIAGLPEGQVLATMEGKLVEKVVRLDNGHVLVELSGALNRPTNVSIRVTRE